MKRISTFIINRWMVLLVLCLTWQNTFAIPPLGPSYLKRSPRALLMGDAYTAAAEGDHAQYYNPALLGRHSGLSVFPLNFGASFTNILDETDRFEDVSEDPVQIANSLNNFPIHVALGGVPGFQMGHFGFSVLLNVETNMLLTNSIHPTLDIDYRYDNGFVVGYGAPVYKGSNSSVSLGANLKMITREGISDRFALTGTRLLDAIDDNSDDFREVMRRLGMGEDSAWGFDVGIDYHAENGPTEFGMGLAILDVANTTFEPPQETETIPDQKMIVAAGMMFGQDFGLFNYKLTADIHPMNHGLALKRYVHLGAQIGIPGMTIMAGYGGGGFSYGGELNLLIFKLYGGFYQADVGSVDNSVENERILVYLKILDFSFDA